MTPAQQQQVDAIERDRRKREEELLALLLLFVGEAIDHASYALRLGHDPQQAARNVLLGHAALDLSGAAGSVAKLLAASYADGVRRAARFADIDVPPADGITPGAAQSYLPIAGTMMAGMSQTIADRITQAIANIRQQNVSLQKLARQFRRDLKSGGFGNAVDADGVRHEPYILQSASELAVVNAHGAGMWHSLKSPAADAVLVGFVHRSVLDGGTTEICAERDGFARPKEDGYWEWNWPSLHWGCRSCVLPLFGPQAWSEQYPVTPPSPGFGRAPWTFGVFKSPAA